MAELGYRSIALDLPGFGSSPMPPWEISIPGYGRLLDGFREALGVGTCDARRQLDGRLHRRRGRDRRARVGRAPRPRLVGRDQPREDAARAGRGGSADERRRRTRCCSRLDIASMRRPGLRELAFGGVMRHPEQMPRELLRRVHDAGARRAGIRARRGGADRLRPARPAEPDPGADARRLGPRRPRRPGRRRRRLHRADPDAAARRLRGLRARPDGGATRPASTACSPASWDDSPS